MKPVEQTNFEKGSGDCVRACIASILELEIDDVPNFTEMAKTEGEMWEAFAEWLAKRRYAMLFIYDLKNLFFVIDEGYVMYGIGGVPSQNIKGCDHAVVVKGYRKGKESELEIVHDPNPNNDPYDREALKDTQWLIPIQSIEEVS